ncbi:MAG: hypothetical protein JXJ17_05115 [Anaerolineae bacterium]|nr:hypothetical protein [Anaerolineae bacterium]
MTRKRTDPISLRREPERPRRKRRRWIIPVILVVIIGGAAVYVYRFKIKRAFEPAATLPPPPPTRQADDSASPDNLAPAGPLYESTFDGDQPADEWEQFDDGIVSAAIADGQLMVEVKALVDTGTWAGLNYTFEDFDLEVDAKKVNGGDESAVLILFRMTDEDNYNRLDIYTDGYYSLSAIRDGEFRVISDFNKSEAIITGNEINRISVSARGDQFSFAVNGETLPLCVAVDEETRPLWDIQTGLCLGGEITETWENGDLPRGKIGLGVHAYVGFDGESSTAAAAAAAFDNLVIQEP